MLHLTHGVGFSRRGQWRK